MGSSTLHDSAYQDFLPRLREWRNAAGLTQKELAARLGKLQAYVQKSEVGERRLDCVEFGRWLEAMGVDWADAEKAVKKSIRRHPVARREDK